MNSLPAQTSQQNALPNTKNVFRGAYSVLGVFFLLALALSLGLWVGRLIPSVRPWTLADLRLLDTSDAPDPAADITAIYTRPAGFHCEIRLDFLDLPETPQYDFTLSINQRVANFNNNLPLPHGAKLTYDYVSDFIVVDLDNCALALSTPLTVQTAAETLETRFGVPLDVRPARLQFMFYNAFSPVASPAQALRRWDGAHTGPRGERHGLSGLLDAAEKHHVPLVLLDVKTPSALSAIDALGGMGQLRRMEQAGLLEMPPVVYGEPKDIALALSISTAQKFGLSVQESYDATLPDPSWPFNWPDSVLGHDGLSLDVRRELLEYTIFGDIPLLVGGDFQRSTWGTYEYADTAFAYLSARPYIQFVKASVPSTPVTASQIPQNAVAVSAFETQFMLAASDPQLTKNYTGIVAALQAASTWVETPAPRAECKKLCILASDKFYAVLNPHGGRLAFFFAGSDQVIGPTAQFFVGLSDSSQWDLSKAEGADPAQVMGAFADADDAFRPYQPEVVNENTIRFLTYNGHEKTYRLVENGLEVTLSSPVETKIPLVVAPQTRFEPGWASRYRVEQGVDGIRFGVVGGPTVSIQVTGGAVLAVNSFLDALPLIQLPEDPNAENPPGFYLPFPVTIVSLSSRGPTSVKIYVTK